MIGTRPWLRLLVALVLAAVIIGSAYGVALLRSDPVCGGRGFIFYPATGRTVCGR